MSATATAKIVARGFARAVDKMAVGVEQALVVSLDKAHQKAFDKMRRTKSFRDRTESLRSAFWAHGSELEERVVEIDDSVENPMSKTPPNTYGRFLEFGTSRISPRGFAEAARDEAELTLELELERRLARVLGGSIESSTGALAMDEQ